MAYAQAAGTPAGPVVEVSPWGRRFAAWFIDGFLLGVVPTAIMFTRILSEMRAAGIFQITDPALMQEQTMEVYYGMLGEFTLISFLFTLVSYAYYLLMHGTLGRTLGKMAVGIKVVKDDGSPCDFAAAAKRGIVHPLATGAPTVGFLLLLLNGLWPLWDERHQSLGDKLGKTYVVRKQPALVSLAGQQPPPPPAAI